MTLQKKIARSVGKNLSFYLTGSILTAITIMLLDLRMFYPVF